MIKHESKSAILFRHWIKANPFKTSAIETKDTRGKDYLNFNEISEAQLNWGMAIKSDKGVLVRVQAIVEGMPDYIYLRNEPAYIVIKYPKFFVLIDVEDFIEEKTISKKRSLTAERALKISEKIIYL